MRPRLPVADRVFTSSRRAKSHARVPRAPAVETHWDALDPSRFTFLPFDDRSQRTNQQPNEARFSNKSIGRATRTRRGEYVQSAPSSMTPPGALDFRTIFETYGPFVARTLRRLEV